MENKIKAKLEEYGLTMDVLTQDELEQLRDEIISEEKGETLLDSVLDNPEIMYRQARRGIEEKWGKKD